MRYLESYNNFHTLGRLEKRIKSIGKIGKKQKSVGYMDGDSKFINFQSTKNRRMLENVVENEELNDPDVPELGMSYEEYYAELDEYTYDAYKAMVFVLQDDTLTNDEKISKMKEALAERTQRYDALQYKMWVKTEDEISEEEYVKLTK